MRTKFDTIDTFFLTYSIINKDGVFYAFGKIIPFGLLDKNSSLPQEIRCIKINCISDIKFYKQYTYIIPKDYDFKKWYSVYFDSEDEVQKYHIEVDKKTLHTIMHSSLYYPVLQYEFGNKTHLIFETNKKKEFSAYLRKFGKGIKVLAPSSFVNEFVSDAAEYTNFYKKEVPQGYKTKQQIELSPELFDKYTWKDTGKVDSMIHWWRHSFEKYIESFFTKEKYFYTYTEKKLDYRKNIKKNVYENIYSVIIDNDHLIFEIAFKSIIDGDISYILNKLKNLRANWNSDYISNLCLENNINYTGNFENLQNKSPEILLTGMDNINKDWLEEILKKRTLDNIPARVLLFSYTGKSDGSINLEIYKYFDSEK